jgi:hypothetical protein
VARGLGRLTDRLGQSRDAVLPDSLKVALDGNVVVVTLSRAQKRKALNDPTILGIGASKRAR